MAYFDANLLASYRRLCPYAYAFAQTVQHGVFNRITPYTTPEQLQASRQTLRFLCREIEAQMDKYHYPVAVGTHQCVKDIYTDAAFRLQNLAILYRTPPEPAAQAVQFTLEDALSLFERAMPPETNIGDEREDTGTR